MDLFAKKPEARVKEEAGSKNKYKRSLGPLRLVMLGVGDIIGAGIFTLTGVAAANHAGPALIVSFVLAAIGCGFAGFCYSEFASKVKASGSAYTYASNWLRLAVWLGIGLLIYFGYSRHHSKVQRELCANAAEPPIS
jgi:amino acid transporter